MPHFINDIPEGETRERLRREILDQVADRALEEQSSLSRLVTYLGLVCSGATIAILGFLAQVSRTAVPIFGVVALICFGLSMLALAWLLYWHYQKHAARRSLAALMASRFFRREATLEDVLEANTQLTSTWLFRLLFWLPFASLCLGFISGVLAVIGVGPTVRA